MEVIRHQDKSADQPVGSIAPSSQQQLMDFPTGKQTPTVTHADGEENDDGTIRHLESRPVDRVAA